MASALIALAIVPAMALVRDSLDVGTKLADLNIAETYCVGKLEEHLALGAATFAEATDEGNFKADGYPQLRYRVVRSQQPADGGVADRLMAITATVWQDDDGSGKHTTGEACVTLATKIAKLAVYQDAAGTKK